MKKLMAIVLATALMLALCACGGNADRGDDTATTTTTTVDGSSDATGGSSDSTTSGSATTTNGTEGTTTATDVGEPGVSVPIGTKPTTAPTTAIPTTTVPTGGEGTSTTQGTSTTTESTTTTTTTVTTAPTVKPLYITLPSVGSDIDVTKKKDRIRVSAVTAWQNDDGTIGVSMSFRNYTSQWITEETDYVEYTCYDKEGNVVQRATKLYIGCIDTKKNVERTYEIVVPADTAEVKITKSKIVYWTEWV